MTAKIDHRRLMAAVLDRAVRDVRETHNLPPPTVPAMNNNDKLRNADGLRTFILALEVRSWFASDREGLFTFRGICNTLDMGPETVLARLAPHMLIRSELLWREYEAGGAALRRSA